MQMVNIDELKSHTRNQELFDDITGEAWLAFLESVKQSGVIEPVVITQEYVIVSGHQRVRACRELGITGVQVLSKEYRDDDEVLRDLIETNLCQRGIGNLNPVKLGRCIVELERIYGITHGGDRKSGSRPNSYVLKTQRDLADRLNISVSTLQNLKSLANVTPELEEWIESGVLTVTRALSIVKVLSPAEQKELAEKIAPRERVSKKEIQEKIDEITGRKNPSDSKNEHGNITAFRKPLEKDMEKLFTAFRGEVLELLGREMTPAMRKRCIEVAEKHTRELIDVIHNANKIKRVTNNE